MAKIDYSKAEESMNEAIERMRAQKLQKGLTVTSDHAIEFYGIDDTPRNKPKDSVEILLEEEALGGKTEIKPDTENEDEYEELGKTVKEIPLSETLVKSRPRKSYQQEKAVVVESSPRENVTEPISPLLKLRKHILWLKTKGIKERYELLGTTKNEVLTLRKKKELTQKDIERVQELNDNAEKVRSDLLKKESINTDNDLIEQQKKASKNKYLSVRDRWLKL